MKNLIAFIMSLLGLEYARNQVQVKHIITLSHENKLAYVSESNNELTSALVEFTVGSQRRGAGLFAFQGINLGIQVEWLSKNELLVRYPQTATVTKMEGITRFYGDFVKVKYEEF